MITVHCSFCGKNQHEVIRIVADPGVAAICNECHALCVDIFNLPDAGETEYLSWLKPEVQHQHV